MSGGPHEVIGRGYAAGRRTDPRIAARIWAALGDARTVANIGAGTGSYEPPGRTLVAVERRALANPASTSVPRCPGAAGCGLRPCKPDRAEIPGPGPKSQCRSGSDPLHGDHFRRLPALLAEDGQFSHWKAPLPVARPPGATSGQAQAMETPLAGCSQAPRAGSPRGRAEPADLRVIADEIDTVTSRAESAFWSSSQ